jgi:hypothetical protein
MQVLSVPANDCLVWIASGMRAEFTKRIVDNTDTGLARRTFAQSCRTGAALSG